MKKKKTDRISEVLWNDEVAPLYYKMGLTATDIYKTARPGQFVMLRAGDTRFPLLRRPFSIHQVHYDEKGAVSAVEILYKVVGKGTRLFSSVKKGETVSLLGPLGRGFTWDASQKRVFLVGGGVGIPPMVFLADDLKKSGCHLSESLAFIGGRSEGDILCREDMERIGLPVKVSTDDGSMGEKGLVTGLIEKAAAREKPDIIYACGPIPMLRAVAGIAMTLGVDCQVSVETMMACGMGACLGCAVKGRPEDRKFKHVCIDGPVFDASALDLAFLR